MFLCREEREMGLGWYKLVVGADYVLGVAVDVIVGFFCGCFLSSCWWWF